MDDKLEILDGSASADSAWQTKVWEECQSKCFGCGGTDKLRVHILVPVSVGGKEDRNGILLCRACSIAKDLAVLPMGPASGEGTRPINFWVSRKLHSKLTNGLSRKQGFRSVAALVRYLMSKYVEDASRFDDIDQWQDDGAEVKVNVWVPYSMYGAFKNLTQARGITVTDTIRGLINFYSFVDGRIKG